MQNRRQFELSEMLRFEAQGAGLEPELFGQERHGVDAQPVRGRGMGEPQRDEIDPVSEPMGDHRQARVAALGRFGLPQQWEVAKVKQHSGLTGLSHLAAARPRTRFRRSRRE